MSDEGVGIGIPWSGQVGDHIERGKIVAELPAKRSEPASDIDCQCPHAADGIGIPIGGKTVAASSAANPLRP